jgi:hypothetical protein
LTGYYSSAAGEAASHPNGMGITLSGNGILQFNMRYPTIHLSMTIGDLNNSELLIIEYYTSDDELLSQKIYTSANGINFIADYAAPQGKTIAYVRITLNDSWIWIDDVSGVFSP